MCIYLKLMIFIKIIRGFLSTWHFSTIFNVENGTNVHYFFMIFSNAQSSFWMIYTTLYLS